MGEVIEVDKATGKKKLVHKVTRAPIDLMAALQCGGLLSRGLRAVPLPHPALLAPRSPCSPGVNPGSLGGTNEYAKGRLGTEYMVRCEGGDLAPYDPKSFYSDEQVEGYVADLVDGRRKFTEEIAAQGLRKDIRELAHRELDAMEARTKCIQTRLAGTVGHHPFA